MSNCSSERSKKKRTYKQAELPGNNVEVKDFQYDEFKDTCVHLYKSIQELTQNHLKRCKPADNSNRPIHLQEVREFAKKTIHYQFHTFNNELGIEFGEIKKLKKEIDALQEEQHNEIESLNRSHKIEINDMGKKHYNEMNGYKQQINEREKYIKELEQQSKKEKDSLRQIQEEIDKIQQEHDNEKKKYQELLQQLQNESQTQIETLNTELESIKEKENKLKQILHEMLEDRDRLQQEIKQIRREYKPYEQFADELNQQLQERNAEIHRLREELQKYISTNGDQIKEIDRLRISYLEAVEEAKNLTERLINTAPSVLPPDFLEKEGTKCQPFIRRSEVISMLLKSQGNKNDMSINESDENNQEKNLTTIEEAVLEDRVCWNETSSSMRMNKMETHTTVYNISTSNVNMNTHCTVKQSDGVLSIEPGDPGVSMLTENES